MLFLVGTDVFIHVVLSGVCQSYKYVQLDL